MGTLLLWYYLLINKVLLLLLFVRSPVRVWFPFYLIPKIYQNLQFKALNETEQISPLSNGSSPLSPSCQDTWMMNLYHIPLVWAESCPVIKGGGVLNKVLDGEAPLQGPTPYPFIDHLLQKRYPFWMSSFDRWHPFHIRSLELFIPFNFCKCTVINHKTRMFSRLFHSHKMNLLALSGFFTEQNDRFPFPLIYFNQ